MLALFSNPVWKLRRARRQNLIRLGQRYATVNVNGYRMTVDLRDPVISDWLFIRRTWEPFESGLIKRVLRPGATFIDIGAHIGYYTLLAARQVGPQGRVLAFEPAPDNYKLLARNVDQNGFGGIVHRENSAVAEHSTELTLYLSVLNDADHRVYPSSPDDDKMFNYGQARAKLAVPAISLDEYLEQHPLGPVHVIKLDVQGAELSVLRGMQTTLAQNPDVVLFMEYWPHGLRQAGSDPAHVLQFLHEQVGMSLMHILSDAKKVSPVTVEEFAARSFDAKLQVDLMCSRNLAALA